MTPALSHEDANARLLDLVYGEAAPPERAALEAHVATCPRCTADLAALGGTRVRVRTALDDDAPVPARAHARILEAAKAELAQAGLAKAEVAKAEVASASPARAGVPARAPSLWDRLRRSWTLPTFATVGAVAIVVLASKVFLEPQRTMERGREVATGEAAPSTPEAQAPQEQEERVSADEKDRARIAAPSDELAPADGARASSLRRHGVVARAHERAESDQGLGTLGGLKAVGAGSGRGAGSTGAVAPPPPARATARDDLLEGEDAPAKPSAKASAPKAAPREPYASPPSGWKGGGSIASGGMGAPGGAPAPAASAPQPPPASAALDSRAEQRSASAPAPLAKKKTAPAAEPAAANLAPAESTRAKAEKSAESRAMAEKDSESASASAEKSSESERKQADGAVQQTLARRADALFAARRWSEAIAAYRELLRVFPEADLRPRWRERLTQAQAEAAPPPAKAGKAASKKSAVDPTPAAE